MTAHAEPGHVAGVVVNELPRRTFEAVYYYLMYRARAFVVLHRMVADKMSVLLTKQEEDAWARLSASRFVLQSR